MSGARAARRGVAIAWASLAVAATLASSGCGDAVATQGGIVCVPPGPFGRPRGGIQVHVDCAAAATGNDDLCQLSMSSDSPSVVTVEPTTATTPVGDDLPVSLRTNAPSNGAANIFSQDEAGNRQQVATVKVSPGC